MFHALRRRLAATAFGAIGLSAPLAAAPSDPKSPDPLDPNASVPAATHRSALASYRSALPDVPVGNWKDTNDRVARIGGWRVYAREAAAPASAPASAPDAHRH